jgi:uncharacterized membrane protein SpoIIM required for sporulation
MLFVVVLLVLVLVLVLVAGFLGAFPTPFTARGGLRRTF